MVIILFLWKSQRGKNVEQAMKVQRRIRGNSDTLSLTSVLDGGWVVNATLRSLFPLERDPFPIVQEAGWAPG
jgi:hypothetical protein